MKHRKFASKSDPCSPRAKHHRAALAWMAARGITQPRPLYPVRTTDVIEIEFTPVAPRRRLGLVS